jgi:hypothetical protein
VLGTEHIFLAKVAKSETAINKEKEPEFDDYAADRLDLWKVSDWC